MLIAASVQAQILTPVKWKINLEDSEEAEKNLTFTATINRGWHVYDMNLPKGGPISTSIKYEKLKGAELVGKPTASVKPTVTRDEASYPGIELRWYSGTVTFTQKIRVTDPKAFKLVGEVEFMACNDESCLPPETESFAFDRKHVKRTKQAAEPTGDTGITDDADADNTDVTTDDSSTDASQTNDLVRTPHGASQSTTPKGMLTDRPEWWTPVIDDMKAFGDATIAAADTSWIYIFLAGFLGGLIALLTPCVWPMIPMTVSFFLKRSKTRRKAIGDALIYGGSIIIIYVAMGLLITGLFGASALNDLSTNAVFNILFFALLVLFAVSFFGAFELVLPSSWTNRMDSKADTTSGILSIFFMAFTLVLVSFSCTGPIIGTLLVEAASQGKAVGPAIGMFGFALDPTKVNLSGEPARISAIR